MQSDCCSQLRYRFEVVEASSVRRFHQRANEINASFNREETSGGMHGIKGRLIRDTKFVYWHSRKCHIV